jgi:hypothetical protein
MDVGGVVRRAMPPRTEKSRGAIRGDGDNNAWSPGRVRSKPLKPLRGEGRVDPVEPVVTNSYPSFYRMRGYGCGLHPTFPAPSLIRWSC